MTQAEIQKQPPSADEILQMISNAVENTGSIKMKDIDAIHEIIDDCTLNIGLELAIMLVSYQEQLHEKREEKLQESNNPDLSPLGKIDAARAGGELLLPLSAVSKLLLRIQFRNQRLVRQLKEDLMKHSEKIEENEAVIERVRKSLERTLRSAPY